MSNLQHHDRLFDMLIVLLTSCRRCVEKKGLHFQRTSQAICGGNKTPVIAKKWNKISEVLIKLVL